MIINRITIVTQLMPKYITKESVWRFFNSNAILISLADIKSEHINVFKQCVTCSSVNPNKNYETYECLGDATVGIVATRIALSRTIINTSKLVSKMVCTKALANLCRGCGLSEFVNSKTRITDSILEDVFEAMVRGIEILFGQDQAEAFVNRCITIWSNVDQMMVKEENYKGILVELMHKIASYTHDRYGGEVSYVWEKNGKYLSCFDLKRTRWGTIRNDPDLEPRELQKKLALKVLQNFGVADENHNVDHTWKESFTLKDIEETTCMMDICESKLPRIFNPDNIKFTKTHLKNILVAMGIHMNLSNVKIAKFQRALTHVSYSHPITLTREEKQAGKGMVPIQKKNQTKYQIIGIALAKKIIGDYLHHSLGPEKSTQSTITRHRAYISSTPYITILCKEAGLVPYILVRNSVEKNVGRETPKMLNRTFHAFLMVLYRYDPEVAKKFIHKLLDDNYDVNEDDNMTDYKILLIKWCADNDLPHITYDNFSSNKSQQISYRTDLYQGAQLLVKGDEEFQTKKASEKYVAKIYCQKLGIVH